jgi:phosphodiesterase/alkaline phosphatase D-like protein
MNDNEMNAYLTNTNGGSFGKNAYMLIYERMKKKPIRQVYVEGDEIVIDK